MKGLALGACGALCASVLAVSLADDRARDDGPRLDRARDPRARQARAPADLPPPRDSARVVARDGIDSHPQLETNDPGPIVQVDAMEPGSSVLRSSRADRLNGPELEAWHTDEQPAFRGTQVVGADGTWVREGEWRAWHESGALHELGAYRGGVEHGEWMWWYEDGTRMARGRFDGGERVGAWVMWHESGVERSVGSYADGLKSGPWRFYDDDGELDDERTGQYENGDRVGD